MTIQEATIKELNEHNIKEPYDRSRGQIEQILNLCEAYKNKYNKEIIFSNNFPNHYSLEIDDKKFEFSLYKDVINALNLSLL